MSTSRKQINLRFSDEKEDAAFRAAIGDIQRAAPGDGPVPSMSDIIREAVFEKRDRLKARRK